MLFKKDRKILNQKKMIENRDIFIDKLSEENQVVYEENKELRFENQELIDILKDIEKTIKEQNYNSVKNLENKIKSILMTAKSI